MRSIIGVSKKLSIDALSHALARVAHRDRYAEFGGQIAIYPTGILSRCRDNPGSGLCR